MTTEHSYEISLQWTGNLGQGTSSYRAYSRDHEVRAAAKPFIVGSSDAAFRGDASRWSPEDLLVASLAQCHMLWYLHLAATAGIVVNAYSDTPIGTLSEEDDGAGRFREVLLRPKVTVARASMSERAASPARQRREDVLHRPLGELPGASRACHRRRGRWRPLTVHGRRGSARRRRLTSSAERAEKAPSGSGHDSTELQAWEVGGRDSRHSCLRARARAPRVS